MVCYKTCGDSLNFHRCPSTGSTISCFCCKVQEEKIRTERSDESQSLSEPLRYRCDIMWRSRPRCAPLDASYQQYVDEYMKEKYDGICKNGVHIWNPEVKIDMFHVRMFKTFWSRTCYINCLYAYEQLTASRLPHAVIGTVGWSPSMSYHTVHIIHFLDVTETRSANESENMGILIRLC